MVILTFHVKASEACALNVYVDSGSHDSHKAQSYREIFGTFQKLNQVISHSYMCHWCCPGGAITSLSKHRKKERKVKVWKPVQPFWYFSYLTWKFLGQFCVAWDKTVLAWEAETFLIPPQKVPFSRSAARQILTDSSSTAAFNHPWIIWERFHMESMIVIFIRLPLRLRSLWLP